MKQFLNVFSIWILLYLASFSHADSSHAPFKIPRSEVHTIDSKILGRSYELYVKLPPDYESKKYSDLLYPTIYLNDGPYTFQVASGVTHLPQAFKKFEHAILVGISFADGENGQFSRVRDLTPVKDNTWKKYETGGAPDYLSFLELEVIPYIEKAFRSDSTRRMLSGQSLGGSFGAYVMLTKPQLFKNYLLTSSSLWFKNNLIFDLEEQYAEKNKDLSVNVYFAVGGLETKENGMHYDMLGLQQDFVTRLRSREYPNLRIKDEVIEGSVHETTFPIGFTRGAKWFFGDE